MRKIAIVVGCIVAVLGGTAAYANVTSSGTVNACVDKRTRVITLPVGSTCATNTLPVSWNQRGPEGLTGLTGPQGPAGADGAQGPAGAVTYRVESGQVPVTVGMGISLGMGCNAGETSIGAGWSFVGKDADQMLLLASTKTSTQAWQLSFRTLGTGADDTTMLNYELVCAS